MCTIFEFFPNIKAMRMHCEKLPMFYIYIYIYIYIYSYIVKFTKFELPTAYSFSTAEGRTSLWADSVPPPACLGLTHFLPGTTSGPIIKIPLTLPKISLLWSLIQLLSSIATRYLDKNYHIGWYKTASVISHYVRIS